MYFVDSKPSGRVKKRGNFSDQEYLYITYLQTDCLNIDGRSGSSRNNQGENIFQTKCTFCGGTNHSAQTI